MSWKVTGVPAVEPITVGEAKANMKVASNAEDTLIESLIVSARDYCEQELDLAIIDQEITLRLYSFPVNEKILLPRSNLLSITEVSYTDDNGDVQPFTDYATDTFALPGSITFNSEIPNTSNVIVKYRVGFAPYVDGVPQFPGVIRQAMLLLVSHWYENRSAVIVGDTSSPIALSVEACLMKYRRLGV